MYRRGMLVIFVVLCAAAVSYSQQVRVASWNRDYARCRCINPFTPFEGGGARGYGGGPTRSGARNYGPARNATNYTRQEIEGMERLKNGGEVVGTVNDIWRERAKRETEARREAARVQAAKGDRWQPTSDWRPPRRLDPRMYREADPGRGRLQYDPSRIGSSYFREPAYTGPSRSTREQTNQSRDGRRTSSEGYSGSRDAGATKDRSRDTAAREIKDWFERVLEKGSRRP